MVHSHGQPLHQIERRQRYQNPIQRLSQRRRQTRHHRPDPQRGNQCQVTKRSQSQHRPLARKHQPVHQVNEGANRRRTLHRCAHLRQRREPGSNHREREPLHARQDETQYRTPSEDAICHVARRVVPPHGARRGDQRRGGALDAEVGDHSQAVDLHGDPVSGGGDSGGVHHLGTARGGDEGYIERGLTEKHGQTSLDQWK
mmetsp:Transcript_5932/g.12980  ORF Transcript_5932/g.12980 Transcript_5932/m.12980 type:complete len:200 (+) Transcript_5932:344-943(+)